MEHHSSAFGSSPTPYDRGGEFRFDELGVKSDSVPDATHVWTDDMKMPLVQLSNAVILELLDYLRGRDDDALRVAANHFASDIRAVVDESMALDGRGAARSARAVFEDAVVLATLHREPDASERFLAHGAFDTLRLGDNGMGLELLDRKERKRAEAKLDRSQRLARREARRASRKFSKIDKGWMQGTLYDKCKSLGWEDRYNNGYRVLSSTIHGSVAGILGNRRGSGTDAVYRWGGPALEWVPLALLEMFRAIELLVAEADANWPDFDTSSTRHWLVECFESWPEMRRTVLDADRKFWPANPTPGNRSFLAVYPNGDRWFIEDALRSAVCVAEPPSQQDFPDEQWMQIHKFVSEIRRREASGSNGRPVTLVVEGLTLSPKDGAIWASTSAVLEPLDRPDGPKLIRRKMSNPRDMI